MQMERGERGHTPAQRRANAAASPASGPVVVLRGIGLDRRLDWVYAPRGWDVAQLEQGGALRRSGTLGQRRGVVTPTRVRQLIALYGQQPVIDLQAGPTLSELLDRHTLAVEVLLATR